MGIEFYYAKDIAPILHINPAIWVRTVRENPCARPPFPIIIVGDTVKIPKKPFDDMMREWGKGGCCDAP